MTFHGEHVIRRSASAVQAAVLCGALMGAILGVRTAKAQNAPGGAPTTPQSSNDTAGKPYAVRRQELLKDIKGSQQKLDELRVERLQLESRVEAVASKAAEQRANTLMLSRETYALRQLDSLLTISQDNLLAQRDRFLSLGEAVRRRAGAELVVVFRADSSSSAQQIDSVRVNIDEGIAGERHYSIIASGALANGAIDELYRSNVLPASHAVALTVHANGAPLTQTVHVDAAAGAITYVQFMLRNGQMTQTTWANRDNATP
jgi:hypothetical protein